MVSMAEALAQIKARPGTVFGKAQIEAVCRQEGHVWRERKLPPAVTLELCAQQVLQGPLSCQNMGHLAAPGQARFSGAAFCQARARLPRAVFAALAQRLAAGGGAGALARWHGHRTFFVDGTGFTLWDNAQLRAYFGLPGNVRKGCGFPVGHLLVLFNAHTGLCHEAVAAPGRRGDLADLPALLERLASGDVLVGDESFGGYAVLALLTQQGSHGLFPIPNGRRVDFTPERPWARETQPDAAGRPHSRWLQRLGPQDQRVEYHKPAHRPAWLSPEAWAQIPATLVVRELRRTVQHPEAGPQELTMVTTLVDPRKYPARDLLELRGMRWEVETDLAYLKTALGMDTLTSRTVTGVHKEVCLFVAIYNLVRQTMREAARRQHVPPRRISFTDALRCLCFLRPGQPLPTLHVNPDRPQRIEPRVKKRRDKAYPYMTRSRAQCRQRTLERRKEHA